MRTRDPRAGRVEPPKARARCLILLLSLLAAPRATAEEAPTSRQPVLVLGKTQLLHGPKAYPDFCAEQETEARPALRKATIQRLKAIAAEARPRLQAAVGKDVPTVPLWLINGVLARLTTAEIERVRAHDDVLWVYPAGQVPTPQGAVETVSQVLEPPRNRTPFSATGKTIPWHVEALRVPRVWSELGESGEGVVVGCFDSGVNYRHEDVQQNVWRNADEVPNNGRDDDHNGFVDDVYGYDFTRLAPEVLDRSPRMHGALTSSVIVGDGSGGTVTGVAPRARVMALLASGGPWNAASALEYALAQGADVLNMSFSVANLGDARGLWRRMAEHASAAGLVLVSGAGNFGQQEEVPRQIRIPEGIPCVICVGGLTRELAVPDFVSRGPVDWSDVRFYEDYPLPAGLIKPDVCAFPGPGLELIDPEAAQGYLREGNRRRGNSLSAPQVAGVIALMLSANPDLNPWQVKQLLEATARDLESPGKDNRTGAGLIDAFAAVQRAKASRAVRRDPR